MEVLIMDLIKKETEYNTYEIKITDEQNELLISMVPNGDLYMALSNGETLNEGFLNDYRWIDITKQNNEIYKAFDNLYYGLLNNRETNSSVFDEDDNIVWVSDDGIERLEDALIITQYEDYYHLLFVRNNEYDENYCKRKSSKKIVIRFSGSGSRYKESISSFMALYQELCNIKDVCLRRTKN